MSATVLHGDCLAILPTLGAESFHAVVTDPPYHLTSIVKRFGAENAAPAQFGKDGAFARASRGFMGKQWDGGDIAFRPETWSEVARVMKPGAYLAAFGGTRTFHRMAVAIEDAGFEIRDTLMWLYGTGFPKSHDMSKAIDKLAGAERKVVGFGPSHDGALGRMNDDAWTARRGPTPITAPATSEAARWSGWGTALKPAWEPIILARKPLVGTVAENVLRHGAGGINIDASRVPLGTGDPLQDGIAGRDARAMDTAENEGKWGFKAVDRAAGLGRWPANVLHDGSDEVVGLFPETTSGSRKAGTYGVAGSDTVYGKRGLAEMPALEGDSGSAARFFKPCPYEEGDFARFHYSSKASAKDRAGSKHPTVKPLALMRWLCTLITPSGGRILDPFAGSGTTLQAARECGFEAVGIEREEEYVADIRRRLTEMELTKSEPAKKDTVKPAPAMMDLFA